MKSIGSLEEWKTGFAALPIGGLGSGLEDFPAFQPSILPMSIHHCVSPAWNRLLGLTLVFLTLFITTASNDRQAGVFAEAGVRFGEAAHDKQAAFGAFDNFDVLACSAQAHQR